MRLKVKRKQPERQFHQSVAQFLDVVLQSPVEWTSIGHGGGGAVRGAILKSMGLKPGWPDIIISSPIEVSRCKFALMVGLELKSQEGTVSLDQKRVHSALERSGWQIFVCRNLSDVLEALDTAGVPHRRVNGLFPNGGSFIGKGMVNV